MIDKYEVLIIFFANGVFIAACASLFTSLPQKEYLN